MSTPAGSAARGMLLEAMQDNNIAAGKVDAYSDFSTWSEIMEYRETGKEKEVLYLHFSEDGLSRPRFSTPISAFPCAAS